jgi:hypothetical protein
MFMNPRKHRLMPGKSCCNDLLEFLEKVTSMVVEEQPKDVVVFDFAKAFDEVPIRRLLVRMRAQGIWNS